MNQKEQRAKYLMKNTAIFAIGSIATKLISFFLAPLYTNALTTEQYGTADLVTTICTVLAPIIILNISEGVMRFALDKDVDYIKIMSIGISVFFIAIFVGLLIIPVAAVFPSVSEYATYIYFYTIMLAGSQLFLCYLRGKELLTRYAVGNIIQTFSIAILNIIFLLYQGQGLKGYFKAYIYASLITMIYAMIVGNVKEVFCNPRFEKKLTIEMIEYSIVLIPNTFMWWIMNSSDRLMVTAMIGASANGIYAVSYKVPSLVSTFTGIFNQAWGYSAIHENESEDRDQYSNSVYKGLVAASVIVGAGLLFIMKPFLRFYVETSYYGAWKYTPYLIIGNVFMTMGTFLASSYTVNKDSKGFLFSAITGALINIILNYFLIPIMGVSGAACSTCFSYIVVFIYRVIDTRKYIKINVLNKKHMIAYVILILSAFFMFIDGILSEVLLFIGVIAEIIIFNDVWSVILKRIVHGRKLKR